MRLLPLALAGALLSAAPAAAQTPVDPAMMEAGNTLFRQHCAMCHQADGRAPVTSIPSLGGNENIADAELIVIALHQGIANMPPFVTLSDADIAAIATYVRNSWGNTYGAVTEEEVAATRAELDPPPEPVSIWDGVYTTEQANAGRMPYQGACALCHGSRLNGAPDDMDMQSGPPLARANFLRNWNGRSLGSLYSHSRLTMPKSNPGFLPEEDYAAIIAYMLATSNIPAGDTPLPADPMELGAIIIHQTQ